MNWAYVGAEAREGMRNLLQLLDYEVIEPDLQLSGFSVNQAVEKIKLYLEG